MWPYKHSATLGGPATSTVDLWHKGARSSIVLVSFVKSSINPILVLADSGMNENHLHSRMHNNIIIKFVI